MSTTLPAHFSMRPAKMDDVEAVTALLNACAIEQVGKAQVEAHEIRNRWQSPTFDLKTDSRVVIAPDGKFVGYGGVWDVQPHVRIYGGGARASCIQGPRHRHNPLPMDRGTRPAVYTQGTGGSPCGAAARNVEHRHSGPGTAA